MNEGYTKALQLLSESIKSSQNYEEFFRTQNNIAEVVTNSTKGPLSVAQAAKNAVDAALPSKVSFVESLSAPVQEQLSLNKALDTQMRVMVAAQNSGLNSSINKLLDSFQQASWQTGMDTYLDGLSKGYSAACDVALLKNVKELEDLTENGYSSSIKSLLNKMQKRTGERLSHPNQIEVSVQDQIYRPTYNVDASIDAECMNVVASSTELFSDITETELIGFIDELSNYHEFASEHSVGKEIWNIIQNWNSFIGFDCDYYYHARPKRKNGFLYTSDEMGKAPDEYVESGRFNHMMQSHYYFSDTEDGAEKEVKKHKPKSEIQTARLKPKREIYMIDLSEKINKQNLFLQYLRFSADDDKKKKEYLLPEYVATCCRRAGIEGIKYYGGKKYKNYVTWDGDYFEVELTWK